MCNRRRIRDDEVLKASEGADGLATCPSKETREIVYSAPSHSIINDVPYHIGC